jgi:protein-S-isoprenylcysteine O-methyltransferase Ste14
MEQKRRIVPPVWLLLTLIAMGLLQWRVPMVQLIDWPLRWISLPLILVGFSITLPAASSFVRSGTPLIPFERSTAVVTGGLFRYTRNPMYLGMVVFLLGMALLLGSLAAFLPIPAFVAIIQKNFIEGEERFMEELFGEEYLAYKRRVRRWI